MMGEDVIAILEVMNEGFSGINNRLDKMELDIKELKKDVAELKVDVSGLKTDVAELKMDVADLKVRVDVLETDVRDMKLNNENHILPLLNEISVIYRDTFSRYKEGADSIEKTSADVVVMKEVIGRHSEMISRHDEDIRILKLAMS